MIKKVVFVAICLLVPLAWILAPLTSATFPESSFWAPNGIWSIAPPIIAVLLAFATRNVVVSLLVGVFSAGYLLALGGGAAPVIAIGRSFEIASQTMLDVVAKPGNAGILLQCGAIGGLVGLLAASGGVRAVAEQCVKLARGPIGAQLVSWLLGLFVFFDDYANVQIRGPIVRPITDRARVSREKLAFILDATAAPIAGIALISTWIGTEVAYLDSGLTDAGLSGNISAYGLFVSSIPYRFYNLLMLAFVFFSAVTLRDFGPMRKAEILARKGFLRDMNSEVISIDDALSGASDGVESGAKSLKKKSTLGTSLFAIVPLLVLIVSAFAFFYASGRTAIMAGGDAEKIATIQELNATSIREILGAADAAVSIFRAALLAGIVAFGMNVVFRKTTVSGSVNAWLAGVKSLCFTFVILILAWTLSTCINKDHLGTAQFLVGALSEGTPTFLLPTLIFVFAAVISFATGTSYGTMAIVTPLAIPFANALMPGDYPYLIACAAAVLTGAIFGDHGSPISDTTILSATSARCGMLEHVETQLPYGLFVAGIAILFGFLPVGFGVSIWVVLPVAIATTCLSLRIFGKKIPAKIEADKEEIA